jgi:hypothetical protein
MEPVEHAFVALAIQVAVGLATRNWWAGACLASGYFLGREIAQAEYRWIEQFGNGLRKNAPFWAALDVRVWPKMDQWIDWIFPVALTFSIAQIVQSHRNRITGDPSGAVKQ